MSAHAGMRRSTAGYTSPEIYDTRNTRDSAQYWEVLKEHWTCNMEEYSGVGGNIMFCHGHRLAVRIIH